MIGENDQPQVQGQVTFSKSPSSPEATVTFQLVKSVVSSTAHSAFSSQFPVQTQPAKALDTAMVKVIIDMLLTCDSLLERFIPLVQGSIAPGRICLVPDDGKHRSKAEFPPHMSSF